MENEEAEKATQPQTQTISYWKGRKDPSTKDSQARQRAGPEGSACKLQVPNRAPHTREPHGCAFRGRLLLWAANYSFEWFTFHRFWRGGEKERNAFFQLTVLWIKNSFSLKPRDEITDVSLMPSVCETLGRYKGVSILCIWIIKVRGQAVLGSPSGEST